MPHRAKYPRTYHLPFSKGPTSDDKILSGDRLGDFMSHDWYTVTEKMDGECTSMDRSGVWARSLDSKDHPSRHIVKRLWSIVSLSIPSGVTLVGENVTAVHSIRYDSLPGPFLMFGAHVVKDGSRRFMSWLDTVLLAKKLGIPTVPELGTGKWSEILPLVSGRPPYNSAYGPEGEGFVIRSEDEFSFDEFSTHVAKVVRPGHVQTEDHWMHGPFEKNGFKQI